MTPEQQRIALAEACGWRRERQRFTHPNVAGVAYFPAVFGERELPDYCNDLNAMHEAENILLTNAELEQDYYFALDRNFRATAAQRGEAILRMKGRFK